MQLSFFMSHPRQMGIAAKCIELYREIHRASACERLQIQANTCSRNLHRIHTFVESQQSGSKVKQFFCQGEMNTLLKDCKMDWHKDLSFFG
jgi:hypothetical protein